MDLLPIRDFTIYCFTKLSRSFKCWHILLYNIKASQVFTSTAISEKANVSNLKTVKSLSTGKLSSSRYGYKFSKIVSAASKLKFCNWQQVLSVVFRDLLFKFSQRCRSNTQIWIRTCVFLLIFQVKIMFCGEKKKAANSSWNTKLHKCFSWRQIHYLGMHQTWCIRPNPSPRILKRIKS